MMSLPGPTNDRSPHNPKDGLPTVFSIITEASLLLFPLCMQHLHEQGLGGRTASTMLHVEVLLASGRHRMDFRNNTEQFTELRKLRDST